MKYICAGYSDKGNVKKTNEDSFSLTIAETDHGQIVMGIVCDGVGGFSNGELASGTTVQYFSDWFEKSLPDLLHSFNWNETEKQWEENIKKVNQSILKYSNDKNITLGTTAIMALFYDEKLLMLNVGDSRLYEIGDNLKQLSKDQSVVQREVDLGNLRQEDMEKDPRRNVLLQCIGATRNLIPDIKVLPVEENKTYLLCSDGFRHKLESIEIINALSPSVCTSDYNMQSTLKSLVDLVKKRQERDNISVLAIKTKGK
ncbi:MAG: protein phosphatase 2C domain-containing protein [Eubacterium sp.]